MKLVDEQHLEMVVVELGDCCLLNTEGYSWSPGL
jgi:hypothetical protein